MSPTALPESDDGYVSLPRRWSLIVLWGAITYLVAAVFAATMIYAKVGDLEAKDATTDKFIAGRIQINEKRWEELHRMNERIVRLETTIGLNGKVLERIEAKLDRR